MCLFVCLRSPVWTVWPLTLIFGMRVDLDLGSHGIEGQDRRSKFKVKLWQIMFYHHKFSFLNCFWASKNSKSCICAYLGNPLRHHTNVLLSHLNRFSTGAEWSILVLGFAKYSKRSSETQVSYTLKNIIECSSQGAFKMDGHSKWLLFRQVAPLRSITLLINVWICTHCSLMNCFFSFSSDCEQFSVLIFNLS